MQRQFFDSVLKSLVTIVYYYFQIIRSGLSQIDLTGRDNVFAARLKREWLQAKEYSGGTTETLQDRKEPGISNV